MITLQNGGGSVNRSHGHHHRAWTREQLSRLENPERVHLMPPMPVLQAIDAPSGGAVADVGAGLGWLTFPLAVRVGNSGTVWAIDPSRDGIEVIRARARQESLNQIRTVLAPAEDTGLDAQTVDRIVWHTMYHDVADRQAAIREMYRILRPDGRWVIVDWEKRPMVQGPPLEVRIAPEEVEKEVTAAGFSVRDRWSAGPVTWGLTLEKPR